jgi:flagellar protein FlaG
MDISVKSSPSYPVSSSVSSVQQENSAKQASGQVVKTSQQEAPKSEAELQSAVKEIQDFVQSMQRNLEFSMDDSSGKWVVKIVARDSGEVIRQIPSEAALELARNLHDASSLLFDAKA